MNTDCHMLFDNTTIKYVVIPGTIVGNTRLITLRYPVMSAEYCTRN